MLIWKSEKCANLTNVENLGNWRALSSRSRDAVRAPIIASLFLNSTGQGPFAFGGSKSSHWWLVE